MPEAAQIAYSSFGQGLPLIALHGGRLDRQHMIAALEPALRDMEFHRIYPDMPGHGATPALGTASYQDVLDRLGDFVSAVAPDGPVCLAGESRGGYLARALAHRLADRLAGLLLIVPAREPYPPAEDLAQLERRVFDTAYASELSDDKRWKLANLATVTRATAEARATLKVSVARTADDAYQAQLEAHHDFDEDPDRPDRTVTAPTLILLGRQDHVVGYRPMLARLDQYPHASVAVLDGASHSLAIERPGPFGALLADWADRVRTAPAAPA